MTTNSPLLLRKNDTLRAILVAVLGACVILTTAANGQMHEEFNLAPADGIADQEFGYAVAVDNSLIAVGARYDDDDGVRSGSAYLFDAMTGTELTKLRPVDGTAGAEFGSAVDVNDGLVVIGASRAAVGGIAAGAAYLFDASTGAQLRKLTPADGAQGDEFGAAVAIDNGLVAVGAMRDDDEANDAGAVYLFDAISGSQIAKWVASDGAANNTFGEAIAMDNGIMAVGAHGHSHNGLLLAPGAAYLFDVASGEQLFELGANDAQSWDFFGSAIAIDSGVVAVGAWAKNIVFDHSGAAYLFDAQSGSQIGSRLVPPDTRDRQHFGISVAVDNGVVAVGAEGDIDNGFEAGAAYLYDAATGAQMDKLLASAGAVFDRLGGSIAMHGGVVAAGAIGGNSSAGSVYVYGSPSADTDGDGVTDGQDNCTEAANSGQRDTDEDGYGNACDADLNNDGIINASDLGLFKGVYFTSDPDADFDGDGIVNATDLGVMKATFFGAPGPSGVAP